MPRQTRLDYPGAIHHVMSRGDRRRDIYLDDVDRQDFIRTLAEACHKTDWQIHAYCLMSNHFHLVVETPNANLVEGMHWLLSAYTIRLNHRHETPGHVFSGRYKSLVVEGGGNGYLKTVCDYVHLNPVRARLLGRTERLIGYPWSSLVWYLAAPRHRPPWIRIDRVLGEHGFGGQTPAARAAFEQRMERRRWEDTDEPALQAMRRGWCLGGADFKARMLERLEESAEVPIQAEARREAAEAKARRIVAEELKHRGWTSEELKGRRKNDREKLAIAARLRKETILSVQNIAALTGLGSTNTAYANLRRAMQKEASK